MSPPPKSATTMGIGRRVPEFMEEEGLVAFKYCLHGVRGATAEQERA